MTAEQWWIERQAIQDMLQFLRASTNVTRTKVGRRKLRMFACGSCRLLWEKISEPIWRQAVETAEIFADGLVSAYDLAAARRAMRNYDSHFTFIGSIVQGSTAHSPGEAAYWSAANRHLLSREYPRLEMSAAQCTLLRCIFANRFRPVTLDSRWLSSTVLDLARTIYDERVFERLPILADALMDAGCDSEEILKHCHSEGPHVRGCWVVDMLLGKE
jgi:hypothetical protein